MLPFTRDQFLDVFAAYNAANWLAAVLACPLALAAIRVAWHGTPAAGRVVGLLLALMWGWVGFVYQGLFFAAINPAARIFAAAFMLQALLFAWAAWAARGLEYGTRSRLRSIAGGAMIFYALILYPLIGLADGERYPAMPLFGVTPCPLVIFTFGLMLWAHRAGWWLWIVPFVWSLIGGSAALLLSVPQDWALPVSAIAALLVASSDHPRGRIAAA